MMDDDKFQALMTALMNHKSEGAEDDYKNLLVNFMNARNHGAEDQDVNSMLDFIDPKQLAGMRDYATSSQNQHSISPNIELDRNDLVGLLRGRK